MIELNFNLNTKEALECSFNFKEWSRLRNVTCSYLTLKNKINLYTNQLEQVLSEASTYRDYFLLRNSIQTLNFKINSIDKEKADEDEQKLFFTSKIENFVNIEENLIIGRKHILRLRNQIIFRRRFLLRELSQIFFPKGRESRPALKKNCFCLKFDLIRRLHLPNVAACFGHNASELCAATSFVVHLLNCTSFILSHPLKHFLFFNGSRSYLQSRNKLESFDLFTSTSTKIITNRDHFDFALYLLCEIIVQLRSDCLIRTSELDRPIYLINELINSFIGVHSFSNPDFIFSPSKRPSSSILSPSLCVAINKECVSPVENKTDQSLQYLANYLFPLIALS
uniref:Uncharacterized protein n=1 Tax=Meloidogyne enterolobii TaxID=390850 RepID=A0A6V7TRL7_MELEN|nr:unnamed protein product [Meloidogyne enterolobii]